MPLGNAKDVIVLSRPGSVDVAGVAASERSSRTAFGTGTAAGMISGGWEKGIEMSVAVRVGVALRVSAPALTLGIIIRVAGGAEELEVVRAWTAGGRAATGEEKKYRTTATWEMRIVDFIVGLLEEERGWAVRG